MDIAQHDGRMPDAQANARVLDVVRSLAAELHPGRRPPVVSLDSRLDRDLAFDSLARMELLARLERALRTPVAEQVVVTADTPRDLLRALHGPEASSAVISLEPRPPTEPRGAVGLPVSAATLVDVLEWHARENPERVHVHFYDDGVGDAMTYGQLWSEARTVAGALQQHDFSVADRVAIMLPTGRDYFAAFYGVLIAGGVPVSLYPPFRANQIGEYLQRQGAILRNCEATMLITAREVQTAARMLRLQVESLRAVVTVNDLREAAAQPSEVAREASDLAFLQYTSGSTGAPKGVMLTHANVLANIRAMNTVIQAREDDVFVSWLPLYHDMGLIGAWLGSLYTGMPLVVLSPLAFLARPLRWLQAIHRYRGTLSAAPNFAYALCLRRIAAEDVAGLDLSSWRIAFNGAEPISQDTLSRFAARFAACGFRRDTLYPVYGLAEACVGLTFPPLGRGPLIDRVQREAFTRQGRALPAADDEDALPWVGCGRALPGHEVRVIDADGREAPERQEGRVQFRGPSATQGYFHNPDATARLFDGLWLETGDRGYLAQGDLYITGRSKDMIIRGGRNIYPQELEEAAGAIAGVRKGCVAAFAQPDPIQGTERLVMLVETRETVPSVKARIRADVNSAVTNLIGAPADEVVLVPPHTVPKTSSGKIRRAASRALYEQGTLQGAVPAWRQLGGVAAASIAPLWHRMRRQVGALLYGAYAWSCFGLCAPLVWVRVVAGPVRRRWAFLHLVGHLLARVTGIRLCITGLERIPNGTAVFVANHASYLDVYVLVTALPRPVRFVAKSELQNNVLLRLFLRALDTEFVERFDPERGVEGARRLVEVARDGADLLFFAEGTFTRAPGVLPFHLGAFVTAQQAGVPIVPIALRGTRAILRDGSWLPRRGDILVTIGKALAPGDGGSAWNGALVLRDAARAHIVRHSGEPDIGRA